LCEVPAVGPDEEVALPAWPHCRNSDPPSQKLRPFRACEEQYRRKPERLRAVALTRSRARHAAPRVYPAMWAISVTPVRPTPAPRPWCGWWSISFRAKW